MRSAKSNPESSTYCMFNSLFDCPSSSSIAKMKSQLIFVTLSSLLVAVSCQDMPWTTAAYDGDYEPTEQSTDDVVERWETTTDMSEDMFTPIEEPWPENPPTTATFIPKKRVIETTTDWMAWAPVATTQPPLIDDDDEDQDVTEETIDQEIASAIKRAELEPKIIPDKKLPGSAGRLIKFEAGLTNMKLYNISSFAREGPVKFRKTKLEENVELELDLKSGSLIVNGSAVLYIAGIGPKFDFEGTIDSIQIRVLLSYHQKDEESGRVRLKDFQLVTKKITPSLRITRSPTAISKFFTNIFFRQVVPYLGGFLLPSIETAARDIVHELIADHGFVNAIMKRYHESNYIISYDGQVSEEY